MTRKAQFLGTIVAIAAIGLLIGLAPVAMSASPEGWASVTHFRDAETDVQRRIVASARAKVGQLAPYSTTNGPWQTDTAGGDGSRMRSAINIYYQNCFRRSCNLTNIRAQMFAAFAGSYYGTAQKNALIDRIISYFNYFLTHAGPPLVPWNDETTLSFFGIRAQCFEFVQREVLAAGGRTKATSTAGIANASNFRPGMGLYRTNGSHSMVIVDIYWDRNGSPVKFRVVDSNYGSGWINPSGEVPWDRHIRQREETLSTNKVVSFDN